MTGQTPASIQALLARHDVSLSRRLGQHFLADPNIIRRIVDVAAVEDRQVVEVGAGSGALTAALAAANPGRLISYEIDRGLEPVLTEVLGDDIDLRFADIMDVNLAEELGRGPWVLVANLPYNIGTPLVLQTLRATPAVERMVVMVQREVAQRFVARPGSKIYGLPSVVMGLYGDAEIVFRVGPRVFVPPPAVDSAVVVVDRIDPPRRAEEAIGIAANAFGQRRKMLRRSLAAMADDAGESIETLLQRAGVDPASRPETLDPAAFVRLAEVIHG